MSQDEEEKAKAIAFASRPSEDIPSSRSRETKTSASRSSASETSASRSSGKETRTAKKWGATQDEMLASVNQ